jgi:Domain of unknown function (DUF4055)
MLKPPNTNVATASSERAAMEKTWTLIGDITKGAEAARKPSRNYLPKYEAESSDEYTRRLACAPWRPIFADCAATLVAKPFTRDVTLGEGASERMQEFARNVDLQGNNLTVFARKVFADAILYGWTCVLVDFPVMAGAVTIADDLATGARPYFVHVPARDFVALYNKADSAEAMVSHARISETYVQQAGYAEERVNQVRVLEPGKWELWEQTASKAPRASSAWELKGSGTIARNGKTSVPMAFLRLGEMKGPIECMPPLLDLADMQIELFRALSRKDEVMTFSAAPILKVIGVAAPASPLETGPRRAIFVPPGEGNAEVDYLQPNAANIREIRDDIESIMNDMRRLGMQPMLQKANVSVAGTLEDAAKAHSVLQAWAMMLKDTLEQAFVLASEYMGNGEKAPTVNVHTDFTAGAESATTITALSAARQRGDISRRTWWQEAQRQNVLSPGFDADEEDKLLAEEGEALEGEEDIDPVTGQPVAALPQDRAAPNDTVVALSEIRDALRVRR